MTVQSNTQSFVLGPDKHGTRVVVEGPRARLLTDSQRPPAGATAIDCSDAAILSGKINAHTHIYSGLAPLGMPAPQPPPTNFVQILERVWWRLDRALNEDALRASAQLYIAQALLHGTTTLIDHHESPAFIAGSLDVLAEVCHEYGMRACLCYGATERNGGLDEARAGLAECRRFIDHGESELVRAAVGLHASFTVSDTTLDLAAELCAETQKIMHVHVAEDGADVRDAQARGYPGPLERLVQHKALPPGSIVAHGLFLGPQQVRNVDEAGCWIVQNPRSNHGNEVGYPQALAHSQRVALGTDGYPANMGEEADFLRVQAKKHGEPMSAVEARIEAAPVLAQEIFGARVGLPTVDRPTLADLRVVDHKGVRHVFVHGRHVVSNYELPVSLETIRTRASAQAHALWQRMATLK